MLSVLTRRCVRSGARVRPPHMRIPLIMAMSSSVTQHFCMPDIMDTKEGAVEKWLKKEGEEFAAGDWICEVSLSPSSLVIAVEAEDDGILTEILCREYVPMEATAPIASYVKNKEDYMTYLDEMRIADHDDELDELASEKIEADQKKPDMKVLMREIRHLIKDGHIEDGSGKEPTLQLLVYRDAYSWARRALVMHDALPNLVWIPNSPFIFFL